MDKFILSKEQEIIILDKLVEKEEANPPTIKELLDILFPDQDLDARSQQGRAVREFIASRNLEYTGARTWIPKKTIILSEEQKLFISNNLNVIKPLEMARTLFSNHNLTNTDSETREIYKFIKTLPSNASGPVNPSIQKEEINIDDYAPPKTEVQALARVFKYVMNPGIDKDKITERHKRDMKNLIGYLHTMRFLSQINTYGLKEERELFESEFVRCTYNKSLTEEEVSQYIMCCADVIIAKQIEKRIQDLEREQDRQIEDNNGKPNMALVDQISSLRTELHQCINRQKVSIKSLQGERKERLKTEGANKGNIADLIMYAQSEEKRKHLLDIMDKGRQARKNEIERIKSMSDIKGEIFGLYEEEIID